MLTKKQRELLVFIDARIKETGVSPSFDEMKDALDLRSKSGIHRLITALEERGFIRRLPHRARALEILRMPDSAAADPAARAQRPPRGFRPSLVDASFRPDEEPRQGDARNADATAGRRNGDPRNDSRRPAPKSLPGESLPGGAVDLPVLGRIAAGTPIEAIQHEVDRFPTPEALIGGGEHYILEVQGESMINAGIHDGDYAIIKRCDNADAGDIVVALVDNEEATLKKLRKKGASIALEAANPAFETRIYGPDRVSVQGKLVGLIRRYV